MTDTRDLDRLIDSAARQMVSREPSRRLKGVVMARLREPEATPARRLVWAAAVAAVTTAVIVGTIVNWDAPAVEQRPIVQAPATAAPVSEDRPTVETPAPAITRDEPRPRSPRSEAASAIRQKPVYLPPDDISSIEPIETEPIVIAVLDTPPIENDAVSITNLHIEPLTIEPLTAAN